MLLRDSHNEILTNALQALLNQRTHHLKALLSLCDLFLIAGEICAYQGGDQACIILCIDQGGKLVGFGWQTQFRGSLSCLFVDEGKQFIPNDLDFADEDCKAWRKPAVRACTEMLQVVSYLKRKKLSYLAGRRPAGCEGCFLEIRFCERSLHC